jgi:CubicO group peptidase (beta-lactamase class C family)
MIESAKATGGFEVVELERVDNSEVVALVRERDWPGAYGRIALTLEPQPSNLIHDIALSRARPPASAAPIPRISEAEALSALREKLDQASADSLFSGAIIVARNGARVLEFASGKADRERGIPNTVDTRFRIGSMNKMFTAVAVLQLVEDGRVQLSAPVGAYLSDYPNEKVAEQVTVEHLLTHTGGTGDIFGPEFAEHRAELREHADYLALAGERDPAFTPGSRFAYSNYGYILLGAIIEAVTDRSYYDYVRANIFAPAGMEDTGSLPENVDVPGRAVGYSTLSGRWRSVADTLPYRGTAAGGGYSTVGDLIAFSQALHSGVLLNDETLETATETESELGPGTGYGYGFYEFDVNGVRAFGHGGAAAGMDAQLIVYPQSGYAVAVAANRDAGVTRRLADFVGRRLPVDPPAP